MLFENRSAAYSTYVSTGSAEKRGLQPGIMAFQMVSKPFRSWAAVIRSQHPVLRQSERADMILQLGESPDLDLAHALAAYFVPLR